MNAKRLLLVVLSVLLVAVSAACGGGASLMQQVDDYYHRGVNLENDWSAAYLADQGFYSSGMQAILDSNPVVSSCFTNTAAVGTALQSVEDFATDALFASLQLNQTYPDLAVCQQAVVDLARQINAWRANNANRNAMNASRMATYRNFLNDRIMTNIINDAVRTMSDQFQSWGIPTDFIGFPTDNLTVQTRDRGICDYYSSLGNASSMHRGFWNPQLNICTLTRLSAYEYMTRTLMTAETANRFDCGLDAGLNDQVTTDCQVVPAGATAVPR